MEASRCSRPSQTRLPAHRASPFPKPARRFPHRMICWQGCCSPSPGSAALRFGGSAGKESTEHNGQEYGGAGFFAPRRVFTMCYFFNSPVFFATNDARTCPRRNFQSGQKWHVRLAMITLMGKLRAKKCWRKLRKNNNLLKFALKLFGIHIH